MYSEEFGHNGTIWTICTTVKMLDKDSYAFDKKKKTKKVTKEGELYIVEEFDAITGDLLCVTKTSDESNRRLTNAQREIEKEALQAQRELEEKA